MKINKKIYFILLLIIAIVLGIVFAINQNDQDGSNTGFENTETETQSESEETEVEKTETESVSDEDIICVYVCGCVSNPGVYELDCESRVYNAIEAAGGYNEAAATDYINLAENISDGQKIYVPSEDEVENGDIVSDYESSSDESELVNINTAESDELCTLSGIGETRADAIIEYRETNGNFETIEDIMNVSGIKEGSFEKIKDYICV